MRDDGYIFVRTQSGTNYEQWLSPGAYHRNKVAKTRHMARKRADKKEVPFDVSLEDLLEIFPEDARCPVLGIPMTWGGGYADVDSSPSIDRIEPVKGYVKDNLCWISHRANLLKRDAKLSELEGLVAYMKNPPTHAKEKAH